MTPKRPQLGFPNILTLPQYPEFYNPNLNPDFISPGTFYNPYNGYPFLSPRFGGQYPGFPIFVSPPKKDDKSKEKDESSSEKSDEMEGSGKGEEESDKEEDIGRGKSKTDDERDSGKPRISIIRVLQLPGILPPIRGWPSSPRVDTVPLDPIPNTIGYDSFGPRIANPWYNGPYLRSFTPQFIFRR